jgi:hypothetical protein
MPTLCPIFRGCGNGAGRLAGYQTDHQPSALVLRL